MSHVFADDFLLERAKAAIDELDEAVASRGASDEALALGTIARILLSLASRLTEDDVPDLAERMWARVELFGHSVRYGTVEEVEFAGRRFVEIVEPEAVVEEGEGAARTLRVVFPERRKRYHPNAIYALEELPEEDVRAAFYSTRGLFKHEDGSWRERPTRAFRDDDEDDLL